MFSYIIGGLIVGSTAYIVYKKAKNIKEGKSCCGCDHCSHKCNY